MVVGLLDKLFGAKTEANPYALSAPDAHVTPDNIRCVQCGVCNSNCPVGISVRDYARQGRMVDDVRCVQCGVCVEVCPRGTLRWERPDPALEVVDESELAALRQTFFGD